MAFVRPYFFEEFFPSSYALPFAPPIEPDHHELHMTPAEMEEKSHIDKDNFEVYLNVKDFQPHELSVRTINDTVIVEGRQDKRGKNEIPRKFMRSFKLPPFYDSEDVHSLISDDGILEIKARPANKKKFSHLPEKRVEEAKKQID